MPVLLPMTLPSSGSGGGGVPDVDSSVYEVGEVDNVGQNSETQVLSYTNAGPGILRLDRVSVEGNADASYFLKIDDVVKEKRRTGISNPNADFLFPRPQLIAVGQEVEVTVINYENILAEFSSSLVGHRV